MYWNQGSPPTTLPTYFPPTQVHAFILSLFRKWAKIQTKQLDRERERVRERDKERERVKAREGKREKERQRHWDRKNRPNLCRKLTKINMSPEFCFIISIKYALSRFITALWMIALVAYCSNPKSSQHFVIVFTIRV